MTAELPRRVGINAIFLLPGMGGLETYVQELVPALIAAAPRTRLRIYCSPQGEQHLRAADWAGEVTLVSHPLFGVRGMKAVSELTVLGALASRDVELLHSVALTAPLRTRAANVITIADTTWMSGPAHDATTRLWRSVVPPVARHADRLIAISQASAGDIVTYLRVPAERVDVTLLGHRSSDGAHGSDAPPVRDRFSLGAGPLVLMVGTRKPHKNVIGLLRGFAELLRSRPDARLVLAGNPTAHEPALLAEAARLGISERVTFLGFVTDAEREGLYAAAACFVLPSFNEGFGLPILEAMGRGLPVASSNASALPEVGADAALYFDPADPHAISCTLLTLLGDGELRARLRERGRRRAAELSWEATALATLESYRRALAGISARPARGRAHRRG